MVEAVLRELDVESPFREFAQNELKSPARQVQLSSSHSGVFLAEAFMHAHCASRSGSAPRTVEASSFSVRKEQEKICDQAPAILILF